MKYLIKFSYDGSSFSGYQRQNDKRTVQGEIEKVLSKIANEKVLITGSGRTDAKVHALSQTAHFVLSKEIKATSLKKAMNGLLESDIYIKEVDVVSNEFHARFDIEKKEYVYLINTSEYNVFERNYVYQLNKKLDIPKMMEATKYLIGEHDFTSFSKADKEKESMIREIYNIDITGDEKIAITFTGNGFLRYMVRNMVGALIEVGLGKNPEFIKDILDLKDRRNGVKTAEPEGLYLKNVIYREK